MATVTISQSEVAGSVERNWATRLLPSLADVAFAMPIFFLFLKLNGAKALLGDGDTGWHIRAGEWMIAHRAVTYKDLFSYTRPDAPWFAWEWLWDVGAGWLHQRWGMAAVVLMSLLVICLTSAALYRLTLKKCGNPLIAIALTALAAGASSVHWLARPHLFTLLFTLVFYWMLERVREGKTRLLWALPPLMALWTNIHGGFLFGLVLLAGYGAGEFLAGIISRDGSMREGWRRMRPYAAAGSACAAATLINPYFFNLHVHIYGYLADTYHFENVSEFMSMSFHHPATRYLEALLLFGALTVTDCLRRREFGLALLILAWGHMALFSARNIPVFAIIAAPPAGRLLQDGLVRGLNANVAGRVRRLLRAIHGFAAELRSIEATPRLHLASGGVMAFMAFALLLPLPFQKCRAEYDPKVYPAKALPLLRSLGGESRIYTDDEWGDYLAYNQFRVFVDGRSDFYGSDFGKKYIDILGGKYTWRQRLAPYQVDTLLLHVDSSLTSAVKEAPDWRTVYDDGSAIVFRAQRPVTPGAGATAGLPVAVGSGHMRGRVTIAKTETRDLTITPSTRGDN